MINRLQDWEKFNLQMYQHIEKYTISQYGNPDGDDQVESWTSEDCMQAIKKYLSRFKRNSRGNTEQLRDMFKIAHYAQLAYDKLLKELPVDEIYGD